MDDNHPTDGILRQNAGNPSHETSVFTEQISANLADVEQRIERACRRSNRQRQEITLVCVSKFIEPAKISCAYICGARHFGENYAQELRDKRQLLDDLEHLNWHFIGPLQRNKVKYIVGKVGLIHSLASLDLVQAIEERAAKLETVQEVLIQLNLAGEKTKNGIHPDELDGLLESFVSCPHVHCVGLMTMPPFFDDPENARPIFAKLRELRHRTSKAKRQGVELKHLSMGMSGDFEAAIEEGATLVRIGTSIFGSRGY